MPYCKHGVEQVCLPPSDTFEFSSDLSGSCFRIRNYSTCNFWPVIFQSKMLLLGLAIRIYIDSLNIQTIYKVTFVQIRVCGFEF